eukprot:Skav213447  [mRNA]  locus=scaffold837:322198:322716:+ [translate_table: standard]
MVSRMALLVYLLEAKMVYWLYEQPHSSLLWEHPRMQQLVRKINVWKTHIFMGAYGAETKKPTYLWAPSPTVSHFSLPLPQDKDWLAVVDKKVLADGRVQITGNGNLKGTQTYPREFGFATVKVWKEAAKRPLPPFLGRDDPMPQFSWNPSDSWKDADLSEVFQFLTFGAMTK